MMRPTPDQLSPAGSLRYWEREKFGSRKTLRAAIARGELSASRLGARTIRILREDILAYFRAHAVPVELTNAEVRERVREIARRRQGRGP